MSIDRLPINVFDLILVAFLILGIYRGRKHGMSQELYKLIMWVTILVACTALWRKVGDWLSANAPISLVSCYLIAYISIALVIAAVFAALKHRVGDKLVGSDVFGKSEYYLGMGSGFIRFACILCAGLALLNARYYSPDEVKAMKAYDNDVYGSDYFPGLQAAQEQVFVKSMTGPWIRDNLPFMLIEATAPNDRTLRQKEYALPY